MSDQKKELKRIEWSIVGRLVTFLNYYPRTKRTQISMKTGLGYDKCILYLNWMEMMDLIIREKDEGHEVISLNDRGNKLYTTRFKEEEASPLLRAS